MLLSYSVWDVILLLMFFEGRFEKDLETHIKDVASFCGFKISVAHRKGLCEESPDLEEISYRQVVTFSVPVRPYVYWLTIYVSDDGFQFRKFVNARFTSRLETIVKVYSFPRFP